MKESATHALLLTLVLAAALVPATASAERRCCEFYCTCSTPCAATCYWGLFLENCGVAGPCAEQCAGVAARPTGLRIVPAASACSGLASAPQTTPWLAELEPQAPTPPQR
jgi:hypothetical protein